MFTPLNPKLYTAVCEARAYALGRFIAQNTDLNSVEFVSSFPIFILERFDIENENEDPDLASLRERLAEAALSEGFRPRTEQAIAMFADHTGEALDVLFLRMVDDFVNYALPRTAGLPDESDQFDALYRDFEQDLLSDVFTMRVIAPLGNFSDHSGHFQGPVAGLRFAWADVFLKAILNSARLRARALAYLELKSTTVWGGGRVKDSHSYFLAHFQEVRTKETGALSAAFERAEEVVRKIVLTARLVAFEPVYAQCVGVRILGHYSGGHGMVLWNPRDEWIDDSSGADMGRCVTAFRKLFPYALAAPASSIEMLFLKLDDALRRGRKTSRPWQGADGRADIDRLLDYCQALEALLPFRGKQIPVFAARLIQYNTPNARDDVAGLLNDMYDLRNMVMHGRYDRVLHDRAGTRYKLAEMGNFRRHLHSLAVLYLLNPDQDGCPNLRRFIKQLRKDENIQLNTL